MCLAFGLATGTVSATNISGLQQQVNQNQSNLNKVNKELSQYEAERAEQQTILDDQKSEMMNLMQEIVYIENAIKEKQASIDVATKQLEEAGVMRDEQYKAMMVRIQYMYEQETADYIGMLMEASSIAELLNKADFVKEVSDYDDEKLMEYEETKLKLAETKETLEEEQEELLEVEEAQQVYKKELDTKIAAAKKKVKNFETELANAQAKAKEYQATIAKQTALIVQLEEEERKAAEEVTQENGNGPSSGGSHVSAPSDGSLGAAIANYALKFVGNPYVYGGTSLTNGADCSGFTMSVHKHFGISIPRVSVSDQLPF
jgi:septal ring factor EnvC (AmiA/AmiB activator)